jgi:glycerol-3-phosphate acyltransferase PlsY
MLVEAILAIIVAYLLGSIPTAYIAGRLYKGIDIRKFGSGNVGGANIWRTVSRRVSVLVILADVGKGTLALLMAQLVGLSLIFQVIAGLAAIIGHSWSPFLRFSGGRGIATALGVLILLAPKEFLVFLAIALPGWILWSMPVGVGMGMASLPLASWGFGEPLPLILGCLGMFLLMATRRLTANRGAIQGDWKRVTLYRLLLDRDIRNREAWVQRGKS